MIYIILGNIYFIINAFVVGTYWDEYSNNRLLLLFPAFFAVPLGIVGILLGILKRIYDFYQIGFFIEFYFTKKWNNFTPEKLLQINSNTKIYFNENTLKHKIYRFCIHLVNKRNNYSVIQH